MKKLFTLILVVLLPIVASAYDAKIDGINYYFVGDRAIVTYDLFDFIDEDGNYVELYYSYYSGDVVIPESVNYKGKIYSVTCIGDYAFYNSSLTSVTIPNSVTSIGKNAFTYCSLTDVYCYAENVPGTNSSAFYNSSIRSTTLHVPSMSIKSYKSTSPWSSFGTIVAIEDVSNIEINGIYYSLDTDNKTAEVISNPNDYSGTVVIPESVTFDDNTYRVTSIRDGAFYYCDDLTSITIGNSVASIGTEAFYNCSSLTSITIPNSVTSIGGGAFFQCKGLKSVRISDLEAWCKISFSNSHYDTNSEMMNIDYSSNPLFYAHHLFLNGEEIKELVVPNGVISINDGAFCGCSSLTSITIPNSVTSIGSAAFKGCSGLTSVTIPNSVTSIGTHGFAQCGLTSITIPNSITSIGGGAFLQCKDLKSVYISDLEAWCKILFSNYYFDDNGWSENIDYSSNPLFYAHHLFLNGEEIKELVVPNGVISINDGVFYGCNSLTSITIPNSLTSIGNSAFSGCTSLTSVTIGNSVTSIGEDAFYGCSSLTSITIPNSVTSIGEAAFYKCSNINNVKVPVTDYSSFCENKALGCIYSSIRKPVHLIDSEGIEIKDYIVPDGVTSIGEQAFINCSSLTSITIPNSVTSIGNSAFYMCI